MMRLVIDNTNTNSPARATKQRVNVLPQHEVSDCTGPGIAVEGQATVHNAGVTVVGTESGTLAHSHPVRAPSHGQVEPQRLNPPKAAGAVNLYSPWKTHREYLP